MLAYAAFILPNIASILPCAALVLLNITYVLPHAAFFLLNATSILPNMVSVLPNAAFMLPHVANLSGNMALILCKITPPTSFSLLLPVLLLFLSFLVSVFQSYCLIQKRKNEKENISIDGSLYYF